MSVTGSRGRPFELTIDAVEGVDKIDRAYKKVKQSGPKEIRVLVTYQLELVDRIDENEQDTSSEDELTPTQRRRASQAKTPSTANSKKKKNKKKRPRSTATTQMQAQEEGHKVVDKAVGSFTLEIAQKNRCQTNACPNKGYSCIFYGDRHFRLNSDILKQWDSAVRKGATTVNNPPLKLLARLLEVDDRRKIVTVTRRDDRTAQAQQGLTIINNIGAGAGVGQ